MVYQFRLQGHLDGQWVEWFGEVTIVLAENGDTLLTSPVTDQAALFGLLRKIRDLGVPLVSLVRLDASGSDALEMVNQQV